MGIFATTSTTRLVCTDKEHGVSFNIISAVLFQATKLSYAYTVDLEKIYDHMVPIYCRLIRYSKVLGIDLLLLFSSVIDEKYLFSWKLDILKIE